MDAGISIEAAGARAGLNPMMGEWRGRFEFPPVPHGSPGRAEFQSRMRNELNQQFLFNGEVQVTITLYMDLRAIQETSDTADLDNYAKSICDGLKGSDGILFDDTQIQSLTISWLDASDIAFDVEIRGGPDDFVLKPVEFFEMPDGLFYGQEAQVAWVDGKAEPLDELSFWFGLLAWEKMTNAKRNTRHLLRQAGLDAVRARQYGVYVQPVARGFHKSRLVDGGFTLHERKAWQARYRTWLEGRPEAAVLDEMLRSHAELLDGVAERMAAALRRKGVTGGLG
jgi:Holliday junction resolvase RusA-like endonuclease